MVQNETNLVVADNSGAKSVRIFRLYGGGNRKSSSIGDIVLCAQLLRTAAESLAAITGRIYSEDLLDGIFSRFCIGK